MRQSKQYPIVTAAVLLALLILCCCLSALGAGEKLVVGVPVDRCPVFYLDDGAIVGIGADLIRRAGAQAGYTVTLRGVTEGSLKEALDNPDYDLVMPFGSEITSAAGEKTIVSENLFQTPFTLVTAGAGDAPSLEHLRVGMLRSLGGGAETVRQLYPGVEINLYDTMAESVAALRSGKVDALLHNSYVWSYVLQKPAYADLKVQPSTMFSMDFRAGTLDTPEGRATIQRLNEGIAQLTDTFRQATILDYTARRLYRYDLSDYLHQYGTVLVLAVLLVVSMVIIVVQKQRAFRLEQEERVRWLMDRDSLTGVYSINGFRKRVEEILREHPDVPYLLTYSNIKNFKYINDSLGRNAGDRLLRFWTSKTVETLSPEEAMGRLTADQFVVLRRSRGDEGILRDQKEVIEPVQDYFTHRGKENRVRICNGVYVLTARDYRECDVDHMLDLARLAETRARETGEGYAFYNPEQWERGKRKADVVGHLSTALQSGEIQVWYQPQVRFASGVITGAEALLRWKHAKHGWLSPAEVIPTLEESGMIFELDSFVWERVCQDLERWNRQGRRRTVSVNVSRNDIQPDRDLPGYFSELVRSHHLRADQLRLEITETAFAEDPGLLIRTTQQLRALGFCVEMDDFGSGYSSLHMLKEVPVDRIKLDLHFLSGGGDPEKGRIIVSHIITMVRSLGLQLIAEGVETGEQARFLMEEGCGEMQGYYFFRPMPVEEFERLDHMTDRG